MHNLQKEKLTQIQQKINIYLIFHVYYQVVLNYMNSKERQHFLNVVKLHRYGIELENLLPPIYYFHKGQVAKMSTSRTDVRPLLWVVEDFERRLGITSRFELTITNKN